MNKLPTHPRIVSPTALPIYCKDCNSRDMWERYPEHDVISESGNVMMVGYRCKVCGATTLRSNLQ